MRKMNAKIIVLLVVGLIVHQYSMSYALEIMDAYAAFEIVNTVHDVDSKLNTPSTVDLMEAAEEMSEKIDELGNALEQMQNTIETLINRLPLAQRIFDNVEALNRLISRMDVLYELFEYYIEDPESYNEVDLKKLIETFTSLRQTDVSGTLGQISGLLVGKKLARYRKGLFYHLAKQAQDNFLELCDTKGSPQQRLLDLFNIVVDTENRGAVIMSFGIKMEGYLNNVTTEGAIRRAQESLARRGEGYLLVLKEGLKIAPTQFRRCDPARGHRRGVTFFEYERFMQTFFGQVGLLIPSRKCNGGYCQEYPQPTKLHTGCKGFECSGGPTTCHGRIFDCESIPIGSVCEYNELQARRYAWYKIGDDVYGNPREGCAEGTIYGLNKVDQVREIYGSNQPTWGCHICRCTCIEDARAHSSRFINLREVLTNIKDNRVAVGFQLIIKNQFMHIKIMEGKLGPKGTIIRDSSSWLEPEDLQDKDGVLVKTSNGNEEELEWDVDACAWGLYRRKMNLDVLRLPENYLLTGVKMTRLGSPSSRPVQLEIHGTRFDYKTGQLDPDDTIWIKPEANNNRNQIYQQQLPSPLRVKGKTEINPDTDNSIEISVSSEKNDAGQTVLPLLDGLPVMGEPPVPLVGLGLYYKGIEEYGGFLTLMLEEINRADHLSDYEKIEY